MGRRCTKNSPQAISTDPKQWHEWDGQLEGAESVEAIRLRFWCDLDARAALIERAKQGADIGAYPELNSREPILWIRQRYPDIEARFTIERYESNYLRILADSPDPSGGK